MISQNVSHTNKILRENKDKINGEEGFPRKKIDSYNGGKQSTNYEIEIYDEQDYQFESKSIKGSGQKIKED